MATHPWRARFAALILVPSLLSTESPALHPEPVEAPAWSNVQEASVKAVAGLRRSREERRRLAAEARKRAAALRERRRREAQRRLEAERRRLSTHDRRVRAVLARARSLLGVPYSWGGASEAGIDCSGFTMLAYAAAGLHLPHASWLQPSYGKRVADPQPGDLIKWAWNHVSIYLGGGMMIGAHRRGTVSSISPVYGSPSYYRMVP